MIHRHSTNVAGFAGNEVRIGLLEVGREVSSTSVAAPPSYKGNMPVRQMGYVQAAIRGFRSIILLLIGV